MVIETEISTGLGHSKVSINGTVIPTIVSLNGKHRHRHLSNIVVNSMTKKSVSQFQMEEIFYSVPWIIEHKVREVETLIDIGMILFSSSILGMIQFFRK
jgi:hypothetical protein